MPIQTLHLRSNVQGKEPVAGTAAGQLPIGSIGINFNATEPFLTIQDSAGAIRRIAGIKVGAVAPATPTAGEAWLDTTIAAKPVFKVHDGTAWQGAGGGTSAGSATPASPAAGDLWVDTTSATAPVLKVYNGTAFVPIAPDASETVKGLVELATAAEVTAGTDTTRAVTPAGLKVELSKLGTLTSPSFTGTPTAPTAAAGTDTTQVATTAFVQAAQVWSKTGTTLSPKTSGDLVDAAALPAATAAVQGAVRLADAAAVTAGTSGRVVTADQLKATNDAVATAVGGGITSITGTAPVAVTGTGNSRVVAVGDATGSAKGVVQLADAAAITAGTAGRVVDAAQLKAAATTPADATETVKGIVELATAAETTTGTDATRAVHPAGLKVELDKKLNISGGNLTGSVTATERTITAGAMDLATGNFWTCGAIAIPNPTNAVAGMSGLIRLTAAPTSWAGNFKHAGGAAPTIAAFPAIVPFFVSSPTTILCGKPVEGMA
jgi:hypothetical protein